MKKIILILSFLTITVSVFAQNDIQLSQQINNRVVFNPAATGQSGCYNFTVLDREQWIGIKDAPSTQLFNFNKYIKKQNSDWDSPLYTTVLEWKVRWAQKC